HLSSALFKNARRRLKNKRLFRQPNPLLSRARYSPGPTIDSSLKKIAAGGRALPRDPRRNGALLRASTAGDTATHGQAPRRSYFKYQSWLTRTNGAGYHPQMQPIDKPDRARQLARAIAS